MIACRSHRKVYVFAQAFGERGETLGTNICAVQENISGFYFILESITDLAEWTLYCCVEAGFNILAKVPTTGVFCIYWARLHMPLLGTIDLKLLI